MKKNLLKQALKKAAAIGIASVMALGIVTTVKTPIEVRAESNTKEYIILENDYLAIDKQSESDSKKTLKSMITYLSDGSIWREYKYDEYGNITKEYFSGDFTYYEYENEYDDGKLTKVKYRNPESGDSGYSIYEYDDNGNEKKNTYYSDDGSKGYTYIYEYNTDGNMTKETIEDSDGSIIEYRLYEYDANGNITKKTNYYLQHNTSTRCTTYKYDSNGNVTERKIYFDDSLTVDEIYKYEYDADKIQKKWTKDKTGESEKSCAVYEYDSDRDVTKETIYVDDSIDNYTIYEYYDKVTYTPMYRLYNPNSGEHFYTANETERDTLSGLGWKYEGVAWNAPDSSDTPVYRLYNPNAGDHHYTTSEKEKDNLVSLGWKDEGIGWYSTGSDGQALLRLYNPNATGAGAHHYTTSETEKDNLVSLGWKYEGIAWYGGK